MLDAYSPTSYIADHWTAARFSAATQALAAHLRACSVRRVALRFHDAARLASALAAAWLAGAEVWLPDDVARSEAVDYVLGDHPDTQADWHYLAEWEQAHGEAGYFKLPENAVVHLYTSASGGEAKTVRKTATQMLAEAKAVQAVLDLPSGLTALGTVSPQHLYGLTFRIFVSLACGWKIGREQYLFPEYLSAASREPCVWISSPAFLQRYSDGPNRVCGIISAGGMLPENVSASLHERTGFYPLDIYGSSETGVMAHRRGAGAWTVFDGVRIQTAEDGMIVSSPWSGGRQHVSDYAESDGTSLHLYGRSDRIIKLEDKRIALGSIEQALLAHEWIDDAYCAPHPQQKRLAAWLALNEAGIEAWRNQGRLAVIDTLKNSLRGKISAIALPRYWRFQTALPRNSQSKIRRADFEQTFLHALTAPTWQTVSQSENETVLAGRVPLDLTYFGGHFAGFPLVPGVVEVQWAMAQASGRSGGLVRMENLKFQHFIRPNDDILLHLQFDAEKNKTTFRITHADKTCASGRMVWE